MSNDKLPKERSVDIGFYLQEARNDLLTFSQVTHRDFEVAWFHEVIAQALERALENAVHKKKSRIIITLPPRHGKSQLAAINFPAWALGKYPEIKFILSTYGSELSEKHGQSARDLINSDIYKSIFPSITLKEDTKAKAKWMTNKGGSFTAVGIGGAVTGIGAQCITGDALITTRDGLMRLDTLVQSCYTGDVLSYNERTHQLEWKKVIAVANKGRQRITEVSTVSGRILRSTEDHKIFTRAGQRAASELMPHPRNQVRLVSQSVLSRMVRGCKMDAKGTFGYLLHKAVLLLTSRSQEPQEVSSVSSALSTEDDGILFKRVSSNKTEARQYRLPSLQKIIQTAQQAYEALFAGLFGHIPLAKIARSPQPKFQTWDGSQRVSTGILEDTQDCSYPRQDEVCCLPVEFGNDRTPYRSQPEEQHREQSHQSLQKLSLEASRISYDPVSMVQPLHRLEDVYDIQVEDNHNFFANGILVHNCILIDDPHKSREEAESQTVRDTVWEYYRSTLYSRLEGFGAIILIMQRWHNDDLVGRILEQMEQLKAAGAPHDDWEIINFPAIAEEQEEFRSVGEALWPSRFPVEVLNNIRQNGGLYNWASQYQQMPINSDTQEFKESTFRYYETGDLASKYLQYYTLVDPSISQKRTSDNTVVLTIAKEVSGPNIYRIREDAGHFTPSETVDLIFKHNAEYKSDVWLETIAYQKALKYAVEERQRKEQKYFTVNELKVRSNKEVRIRGLLPLYGAGVIFHLRGDTEYEREALTFPGGRHDDRIDCMSFMLEAMENTRTGRSAKQYRPKWNGYRRS